MEFAGIGPAPFCGMLLADLGAEVVKIERKGFVASFGLRAERDVLNRGRKSIGLDLKSPLGVEAALRLIESADILIEGYRPGVMERLGIGPDVCRRRNGRLVYGRMTGWGQDGPMSQSAGHDINYIALSGVLGLIGSEDQAPVPPLNLVGDMGGGGLLLAFGLVCALFEASRSGQGQVVDAAMIEGSAAQLAGILTMMANGAWNSRRGSNVGDGGAPFYSTYETKDGHYVAVGAIEPEFYAALCKGANLDPALFSDQHDVDRWPRMKEVLGEVFFTKTRAEWADIFSDLDACVAPVLSVKEAADHPHNVHRGLYVHRDGLLQPGPVPKFSRTPGQLCWPPPKPGADSVAVLREHGFSESEIAELVGECGAAAT